MALVKVWNDNVHDHKEKFKDQEIVIKAGGFVEMEYEDAIDFRGAYTPILLDGEGNHDPRGFKMIRVEQPDVLPFRDPGLVNHATGKVENTPEALKAALAAHEHLRVKDEDAERAIISENAALKARIAELEAAKTVNKGGRPPKQATA